MAYDEDLAARIRALLADEPDVTEMRMFGGLAFLVAGKMAVAAGGRGGLMARVDPADLEKLLAREHVEPFEMNGRDLDGWVRVNEPGVRTKRQLGPWVARGTAYARALARVSDRAIASHRFLKRGPGWSMHLKSDVKGADASRHQLVVAACSRAAAARAGVRHAVCGVRWRRVDHQPRHRGTGRHVGLHRLVAGAQRLRQHRHGARGPDWLAGRFRWRRCCSSRSSSPTRRRLASTPLCVPVRSASSSSASRSCSKPARRRPPASRPSSCSRSSPR